MRSALRILRWPVPSCQSPTRTYSKINRLTDKRVGGSNESAFVPFRGETPYKSVKRQDVNRALACPTLSLINRVCNDFVVGKRCFRPFVRSSLSEAGK